ncbi:protein EFR3 homolog B-like isoform X2 [Oscarella lobularis]|uniref:protein EFR3 homolog B-like isoform X2 n=1 Tax=Oscarella lobularis TaxID=121494 RepID=UPI00331441DB
MACCGCFRKLKPRYKRHVEDIFPSSPDEGIVSSQMEKLTYYSLSAPEKLDRIGAYLAKRVKHDLARRRYGYVYIAMQALDELLSECHARTLNLFVESFLRIVQHLSETTLPDLQMQAVKSFVQFSKIEEVVPSYHRRYDFFVSKFSSMCFNGSDDLNLRKRLRLSGLQGLQGVIRKAVSDDLSVNIWEPGHIGKICPSLIFNMHEGVDWSNRDTSTVESIQAAVLDDSTPAGLAETCLRNLLGKASFGNIKSVLVPILNHLDANSLWVPNTFTTHLFQIIMFSIQGQYCYLVIQSLIEKLNGQQQQPQRSSMSLKISVVKVIEAAMPLAAGSIMGPSVLEIFHLLLQKLRIATDSLIGMAKASEQAECEQYCDAVVCALGTFVGLLPDYQKTEVMTFLVSKLPFHEPTELYSESRSSQSPDPTIQSLPSEEAEKMNRLTLVKCLGQAAAAYRPHTLSSTLPLSLFDPLIRLLLDSDPEIRLQVHRVVQKLVDHNGNLENVSIGVSWDSLQELGLKADQASKQDVLFMKKNGNHLYWTLYVYGQLTTNTPQHYAILCKTLIVLCLSLGADLVIVESLRVILGLQDLSCSASSHMSAELRCCIHAMAATFMHFVAKWTGNRNLLDMTDMVIGRRERNASYLLSKNLFNIENAVAAKIPSVEDLLNLSDKLLFERQSISDTLTGIGHEAAHLSVPLERKRRKEDSLRHKTSVSPKDKDSVVSSSEVGRDDISVQALDMRKSEEITFESLKKILALKKDQDDAADHLPVAMTYEEMVAQGNAQGQRFKNRLNEMLDIGLTIDAPDFGPMENWTATDSELYAY